MDTVTPGHPARRVENATPVAERCVSSYPARRLYRPGAVHPPQVPGVAGAIDIHVHAHEGQQDALDLARFASHSGMRGLLFKTIGAFSGEYRPAQRVAEIQAELERWAVDAGVAPVQCWAGYGIGLDHQPPSLARLQTHLDDGAAAIWLPVFNHANTYHKVGGKRIWFDKSAHPDDHTPPLPWEEALKVGHYLLDDHGRLKAFYDNIVRRVADHGAALFFGHATHAEIEALAELVDKLGFRRAVVDHPFSPFIDLSIKQMQRLAAVGITLNFTYDEISPLLGVDPKCIYEAIRAVGVAHCTLSSDAGEPLFPHSVECMRLMRGYMEAFGMQANELDLLCCQNPAQIVGQVRV